MATVAAQFAITAPTPMAGSTEATATVATISRIYGSTGERNLPAIVPALCDARPFYKLAAPGGRASRYFGCTG